YILTENNVVAPCNMAPGDMAPGNTAPGGTATGNMAPASKGLAQGDLRLVALALIAETPRHGYEIIKLIEEKTADWYSPAPSIVCPTLTNLAEPGHLTPSADPPRLYS